MPDEISSLSRQLEALKAVLKVLDCELKGAFETFYHMYTLEINLGSRVG